MELDDVSCSRFVSIASANRADSNCHVSLAWTHGRRAFSSRVGKRSSRAWLHLVGHSIVLSLPSSTLVSLSSLLPPDADRHGRRKLAHAHASTDHRCPQTKLQPLRRQVRKPRSLFPSRRTSELRRRCCRASVPTRRAWIERLRPRTNELKAPSTAPVRHLA